MHSIGLVALAEDLEIIGPPSCRVGSPALPPAHASLGEKDCQPEAPPFIFYRLAVHWFSPENRVHNEATDPEVQLDLGGLDLGRERALERLDRQRLSGLGVEDELCSCGIPRPAKSLTRSR
jgi:hypothetical protein